LSKFEEHLLTWRTKTCRYHSCKCWFKWRAYKTNCKTISQYTT